MSTQWGNNKVAGPSGSMKGRSGKGKGSTSPLEGSSSSPRYGFDGPYRRGQVRLAEAQRVLHVAGAGSLSEVSLSDLVVALSTFLDECRFALGPEAFEGSFGTHGLKTQAQAAFRKAEEVRREKRVKENLRNRERSRVQRQGK